MLQGCLCIVLVRILFWLQLMQFGGEFFSWLMVCGFWYLERLMVISVFLLLNSVLVRVSVVFVLLVLFGLISRNIFCGLFFGVRLVFVVCRCWVIVFRVVFWLIICLLRFFFRFRSFVCLFFISEESGMLVQLVIIVVMVWMLMFSLSSGLFCWMVISVVCRLLIFVWWEILWWQVSSVFVSCSF